MVAERIIVGAKHPGPRPKKPARPRKPREAFWKTEIVWSSEEDDILLADLLHLIPSDVKAEKIRLSVERNPYNGYPMVVVTFNHEIPNTKLAEQLRDFEKRNKKYESDLLKWQTRDAEWKLDMEAYESQIDEIKFQIERAFNEHTFENAG